MAAPEDKTQHTGKMNGHGVGLAIIAIFAGMALVVAFAASDGAIFGQYFHSAPSDNVPISDSNAEDTVALARDAFNEGSDANSISATAPPPEDSVTLTREERRLLAMKDFPWDSVASEYIASNQNAFQRFEQQSAAQQKPVEPGTEPLSLSDEVVDVDRDRNRGDRARDDSGHDTSLGDIIEIDIPIDDDEEQQEEEEQPDKAEEYVPEDDQDEEPQDDAHQQDDDAEGDQGSNDKANHDPSGEDSGEDNSESRSDDDLSEEQGGEGESSGSNSTGTSDPSENPSSESDAGDENSTGIEVIVSLR